MQSACLWFILSLLILREVVADEEDPLQHVAQVVARETQLNRILMLLEEASDSQKIFEHEDEAEVTKPCSHSVLDFKVTDDQLAQFSEGKKAALSVANLLNNLYLALPADSPQLSYPPRVFYALTRAALEAEPSLVSIGIAFLRGELNHDLLGEDSAEGENKQQRDTFAAYSYRRQNVVRAKDLASLYNYSYDHAHEEGTQWFTHLSYRHPLRPIKTSGPSSSALYLTVTREIDGRWFTRPFLDCGASLQWVLAYSLPFYGRALDGKSAKLKGVVLATFPLHKVDINQCEASDDLIEHHVFGGTHKCDTLTTQCRPMPGLGFVRGGYKCDCISTHYIPTTDDQFFNGTAIEEENKSEQNKSLRFRCFPCPEGCSDCSVTRVCAVQYNAVTRLVPICIQGAGVLLCMILIVIVFKLRRCKVIASSLWTMLEVILLGSIILYSTVFLRYLEPTVFLCLLTPWIREIGFSLFYGAIVLKLYRTLVEHRTRKAHRYIIRDRDLLRYLAGLVVFVSGYLAAWAAFSGQLAMEGHAILEKGLTQNGLAFSVCRNFWWEYVTEAGELLFVAFGLYLSWQLRKAARDTKDINELRERRALACSLTLELIVSLTLYVGRYLMRLHAHPDHVFLAHFIRTHLTITLSLLVILLPKLVRVGGSKGRGDGPRRAISTTDASQELRLCEAIANGEIEAANLSQMHPEEIRTELRRVYTQLEELRTRTMRKDNPHISKRRGGRKPTHRRFSMQSRKGSKDKFHSKRHHHHQFDGFELDNKTPEESVCSLEGPSVPSVYADGPSTYSEMGTPSLLHRSYKM